MTVSLIVVVALGASARNELLRGHVTINERTSGIAPKNAAPNTTPDLTEKYGSAASSPAVADAVKKAESEPDARAVAERQEALAHGIWKPGADRNLAIMYGCVPPGMSQQQAAILYQALPHVPQMPGSITAENADRYAGMQDPLAGLPQGLSREDIQAANEQIYRQDMREHFGPVSLPPLHRDHNVAALVRVTPDHQGSIREMTDSSGNIVYQQTYDPYGNPAHLQGSGSQPDFGYQGYYFHQRSGLNLTARRAYSPKFGRFLNRDPVKEKGGSNLFAYVDNDPINSTDPSGLQGVWWQPTPLLPGPGTLTDPIVSGPNPLNPAPYFRPPNQAPNEWDPYWDPNDPKDRPQYNRCIEDAYANAKKLPPGHCREKFLEDEIQKCKEKWLNKKWRNKSHPGWGWDPETNAPFEIPVDA